MDEVSQGAAGKERSHGHNANTVVGGGHWGEDVGVLVGAGRRGQGGGGRGEGAGRRGQGGG